MIADLSEGIGYEKCKQVTKKGGTDFKSIEADILRKPHTKSAYESLSNEEEKHAYRIEVISKYGKIQKERDFRKNVSAKVVEVAKTISEVRDGVEQDCVQFGWGQIESSLIDDDPPLDTESPPEKDIGSGGPENPNEEEPEPKPEFDLKSGSDSDENEGGELDERHTLFFEGIHQDQDDWLNPDFTKSKPGVGFW
jgi:hypothetical protein